MGLYVITLIIIIVDNNNIWVYNIIMRIKKNLRTTIEIADYLVAKLSNCGYSIIRSVSGLSNSEYLTITNFFEMTGQESPYNGKEYRIRISEHDLPPSYDGLHGFHDEDIISGTNKIRVGNDGKTDYYEGLINRLFSKILPAKKKDLKDKKNLMNSIKRDLPNWTNRENLLLLKEELKKENVSSAISFINDILYGNSWTKNKPMKPIEIKEILHGYDKLSELLNYYGDSEGAKLVEKLGY